MVVGGQGDRSGGGGKEQEPSRPVVIKMGSLDQQLQHLLGTC